VWRAFDLKLRVDVALKAVLADRAEHERARDMLRQEVRSAREVVSPNVCRIFDLVVEEGRELVSMEYIDGSTLADTLRVRGPLQLQEDTGDRVAVPVGSGGDPPGGLVHRDFKPENVMLTARGTRGGDGLRPGQGRSRAQRRERSRGLPPTWRRSRRGGESVDARADVFSAAVVLTEMLTVGGEGSQGAASIVACGAGIAAAGAGRSLGGRFCARPSTRSPKGATPRHVLWPMRSKR
jgi:serine/threonine-protein kinase